MVVIPGFQRQPQIAAVDGFGFTVALVVDGNHIAAALGDNPGDLHQLTGLVRQFDEQAGGAAGLHQTPVDDPGQAGHVDVAAGDQADYLLALQRELVEHGGGHGNRTGTLGDHLLLLDESQNGGGDFVLGDESNVVHIVFDHFIGQLTGLFHGDAVGNGGNGGQGFRFAVVDGVVHAGGAGGLNAVDLHMGGDRLDGAGHAGDQSAAADGHQNRVHVAHFVHDLQTDGALTGDDVLIVEGVDKGVAVLLLQLQSLVVGVVVDTGYQADLGTVALGGLYLGNGGGIGQADQGGNAALAGGQRHALGVVAGGAGDDTLGLFLIGKHSDFIAGAPKLERAGLLQALGLQVEGAVLGNAVGLG